MEDEAEGAHDVQAGFGRVAEDAAQADQERADEQVHRRLRREDVAVKDDAIGHARRNVEVIAIAEILIGDAEARNDDDGVANAEEGQRATRPMELLCETVTEPLETES